MSTEESSNRTNYWDKDAGFETRRIIHSVEQRHLALLSIIEPSSFEEASNDEHWIKAMEEEMD
jgi:hypothetical protein